MTLYWLPAGLLFAVPVALLVVRHRREARQLAALQRLFVVDRALQALDRDEPRDAFVSVAPVPEPGRGGDAAAFAERLVAMYRQWAEERGMRCETLEAGAARTLLAVSGLAAHAILAGESGLHVLETSDDEHGFARTRARVVVIPQPDRLLDTDAAARDAAARVAAADAAPQVVRRYRERPSPLVRDAVRGWRSGRIDLVLAGNFDLIG